MSDGIVFTAWMLLLVTQAALVSTRRVAWHRTTAALGRIPWAQLDLSPATGPVIGLAALILLLVVYDVLSLRRVHRSTMWAAPLVFAAGAFAVPFGMTPAWHHFAKFLMRVAVPYV
jgi:hypothetical protein